MAFCATGTSKLAAVTLFTLHTPLCTIMPLCTNMTQLRNCKTRVERCRDLVRGAYEGRQPSGALSRVLTKVLVSGVLEFKWRLGVIEN